VGTLNLERRWEGEERTSYLRKVSSRAHTMYFMTIVQHLVI